MKKLIDHLASASGWVLTGAHTTVTEITDPSLIAGLNAKSLMIRFDKRDSPRKAVLTLGAAVDVTGYENLVISTWSHAYRSNSYRTKDDFKYKIKVNSSAEYYLATGETFGDWTIGIDGQTSVDRIEITPNHAEDDCIIISECVAEDELVQKDVLDSTKEELAYFLTQMYGTGIQVATGFSGAAGALAITIPGTRPFLERYAVVKIVEGVMSETHQLWDNDGSSYSMWNTWDGVALLNTYANATVYLLFPISVNPTQDDVMIPGASVWGFDPEPILRGNMEEMEFDTFQASSIKGKKEGQILRHHLKIAAEARHYELIDKLTRAIRRMISRKVLWINGRGHEIHFEGPPEETFPSSGIDIIPKVTYNAWVETNEARYDRVQFPLAADPIITVEVQDE